ncbi:amidohydrolase [Microbulbifer magnicolonia]|uniref:amidohydrolase n=1 Tax=Microbulbifer magnicolonia TaxID=3109744 RepID=UPI002B4059CD|nr:amidohydrolase [Microbulbifer sp. GG15]
MRFAYIVLALACVACSADTGRQWADTVIVNGKVFTGVPDAQNAQAVAIRDGRILTVGSDAEIEVWVGESTEVVDARGRRVIPGLTDAHAHFGVRPAGSRLQLENGPTPDPSPMAVLSAVAAEVEKPSGEGWIYAEVGPAVLADKSLRSAALDRVSPERPVMLWSFTGHGTIFNSAGLAAIGLEEPQDVPGGWCERDARGQCTGLLREMLEFRARREQRRTVTTRELAAAYRSAADDYLRWGVTAVHEMALGHPLQQTVAALGEANPELRWSLYRAPVLRHSLDEAWQQDFGNLPLPSSVRLAGIKWILDGTPVEGGAATKAVYADLNAWRGQLNFSDNEIRRILSQGLERDEQLALHASGDRTLEAIFTAMGELAPPEVWREHRLRIEHGDMVNGDLVDRAATYGAVLVQNPLHFDKLPILQQRFTSAQKAKFQQVRAAWEKPLPMALGSDAGGPGRNPYLNIMFAAMNPVAPDQALTVNQALSAYSLGGAYAEKREVERGTLQPGMLADLAILSQDILEVPLPQLPATQSVLTMVGGEIVYRAPAAK